MIHDMFSRSLSKYKPKYISYVGDADAKVHKYLIDNIPFSDVNVKKIEDINHVSKRILARMMKIKQENKNKVLSDSKNSV